MSEPTREVRCRCGEAMMLGYATASGVLVTNVKLVFVVPGERTSANPIKALKQGLQTAPASEAYLLHGHRCPKCGRVELIALDEIPWTP